MSNEKKLISNYYRGQNLRLHEKGKYGRKGDKWAKKITSLLSTNNIETILDYGCGQGSLARKLDVPVFEYDPAIIGKDSMPKPRLFTLLHMTR